MARPLRIEGCDYWYHVMLRGDGGRTLFSDRRAYQHFLDLLDKYCAVFRVEVHAYALMPNHVHIFVHTQEANLGRFMQRLTTAYSVWYNTRMERSGHVFQGRYKAVVVERDAYGAEVTRYIHLNPARVSSVPRQMEKMRRAAREYRWSSYRSYLGLAHPPAFLTTRDMLARFGKTPVEQRKEYAVFVEEGLLRDIGDVEDGVRAQSVLGSDTFLERMRRALMETGVRDTSAARSVQQLQSRPLEQVVAAVAKLYGIQAAELQKRQRNNAEARRVAMWAAARWCSGQMSLTAIGRALGGVSAGAVWHAARAVEKAMTQSGSVRAVVRRLDSIFKA